MWCINNHGYGIQNSVVFSGSQNYFPAAHGPVRCLLWLYLRAQRVNGLQEIQKLNRPSNYREIIKLRSDCMLSFVWLMHRNDEWRRASLTKWGQVYSALYWIKGYCWASMVIRPFRQLLRFFTPSNLRRNSTELTTMRIVKAYLNWWNRCYTR